LAQDDRSPEIVNILEEKQALRARVKAAIASLSPPAKTAAGAAIRGRMSQSATWINAGSVLLFSPLPDEPDISDLLGSGLAGNKIVCLPRYIADSDVYEAAIVKSVETDLIRGKFSILEPAPQCPILPLNQLDLMLVPGVAFAADGARLGRGKGFYDRILQSVPARKVGIAFDEQITDHVPSEQHDVPVNAICTPRHWFEAD
jgi:5-formyltetrahydrofolate cyclo-ligase